MKTSVLISAYQAEDFIEECLDSIFVQDHLHEVLIAVDGCRSTLKSIKAIEHKYDDRLKVFYSKKNLSPYPQINQLIKLSTGNYIIPFGADDVMRPDMISTLEEMKGGADVLRFRCYNFGDVEDNRIGTTYHPGGVKLYRRGVFNIFGGFPAPYLSADSDLQFRIDRFPKIIRVRIIQDVLFDRRIHENNLTRTIPTSERNLDYKLKTYHSILDVHFEVEEVEYEKG